MCHEDDLSSNLRMIFWLTYSDEVYLCLISGMLTALAAATAANGTNLCSSGLVLWTKQSSSYWSAATGHVSSSNNNNILYLLKSSAHLFQPNLVSKVRVHIRIDGTLDLYAKSNKILFIVLIMVLACARLPCRSPFLALHTFIFCIVWPCHLSLYSTNIVCSLPIIKTVKQVWLEQKWKTKKRRVSYEASLKWKKW